MGSVVARTSIMLVGCCAPAPHGRVGRAGPTARRGLFDHVQNGERTRTRAQYAARAMWAVSHDHMYRNGPTQSTLKRVSSESTRQSSILPLASWLLQLLCYLLFFVSFFGGLSFSAIPAKMSVVQ